MKLLIIILIFITSVFSEVKINLSHKNIIHGSTFAVILQSDIKLSQAPNVIFKNKTYQMFTIDGNTKKYELFLPIDYHTIQQKENIQVKYIENKKLIKKNIPINIVDGQYRQNEIIKVPKAKVTLSKKSKTRSNKEYAIVYKKVYSKISSKNLSSKSIFGLPVKSKITSAFGNARIYNGKTRSYHSGTDFRAKVGTPIYSTNDGQVVLVMNRFYLGKVVYINHGRGAYSYYCHLNKFNVKESQTIKKGDIIGYSGVTGRIMGPHLHYAIRLYNTTVDPLQYGKLYNTILNKYH